MPGVQLLDSVVKVVYRGTVRTWSADKGFIMVQEANPATNGIEVPEALVLGLASLAQLKYPRRGVAR